MVEQRTVQSERHKSISKSRQQAVRNHENADKAEARNLDSDCVVDAVLLRVRFIERWLSFLSIWKGDSLL